MRAAERADHLAHLGVARPDIGEQLHAPDAHDDIGRERRNDVVRIDVVEARQSRRIGRVQMHDGARPGAGVVKSLVQEHLFRRLVAGQVAALPVDLGDAGRVEKAEAGIGRRDQDAVIDRRADVAGGADRVAPLEQGSGEERHGIARRGLVQGSASERLQRLGEEIRGPEIPRLQGEPEGAAAAMDQDGHARVDLRADIEGVEIERRHHGSGGFAAGHDEAADAGLDERPGRLGEQRLDAVRDRRRAVLALRGGNLVPDHRTNKPAAPGRDARRRTRPGARR